MASVESDIFSKLKWLCASPGYIHALALICFSNEIVRGTKPESLPGGAPQPLTYTEIMTLVGLHIKASISYELPSIEDLMSYVDRSYRLLGELQAAVEKQFDQSVLELQAAVVNNNLQTTLEEANPISKMFRGSIFYAGDSAYYFQYLDFVVPKYEADAAWLLSNKNVDLNAGRSVCTKLAELHQHRMSVLLTGKHDHAIQRELILGAFQYSHEDLHLSRAELDFIEVFTLPLDQNNAEFNSATAFNAAYAYPIIRRSKDDIIVLSNYWLTHAFYESPYYWLLQDKEYCQSVASNRGSATELIAANLLERVFLKDNVFKNVKILGRKGNDLGEVDVLVTYAGHVLILQAKSKRLTWQARKGHVRTLEKDFHNAVRQAADQAFLCAEHVSRPEARLSSPDGRLIPEISPNSKIFTLTVLLDHYPALLHQTFFLLEQRSTSQIASPFVTDIFALDTMTEMLDSPLKFLHYLSQRTRKSKLLIANNEHELIGTYLQGGLAFKDEFTLVIVDPEVSDDIDIAMEVRRNNAEGFNLPENLFDRLSGTHLGKIINVLEHTPTPIATNLGLVLLDAIQSSLTIEAMQKKIDKILQMVARGSNSAIFSFGLSHLQIGVTIMCVPEASERYADNLWGVCNVRKYEHRQPNWFGILLIPSGEFAFACELNEPWRYDAKLESVVNQLKSTSKKWFPSDRRRS